MDIPTPATDDLFLTVFSGSPDAMAISRLSDSLCLTINPAFTALTGYTAAEVIGHSAAGDLGLWAEPEDRRRVLAGLQQPSGVSGLKATLRRKDGTLRQILFSAWPITFHGDACLVGVARDITAQVQAEQARQHAEAALRLAHAALEQRVQERTAELLAANAALAAEIAERKQAETTLRENEAHFRAYIEHSPEGLFVVDAAGRFREANPAACHTVGYPREALLELSLTDLVPPEDAEATRQAFGDLLTTGALLSEAHLQKKDGALVPVLLNAVRLPNGDAMAFCTDMTERQRAEEALRASAEQYSAILQTTMDGFWMVDLQGRFIEVNDAACKLAGYPRDELLTMAVTDLDTQDTAAQVAERIQRLMETGAVRFDSRHRRKDGRIIDVEVSITYLPTAGRLVAFLRDITAHQQAAAALRESEARFRSVVEQAHEGIALVDEQGRVITWNRAMEQVTGLAAEAILNQPVWDVEYQFTPEAERTPQTYATLETNLRGLLKTGQSPWENRLLERRYALPTGATLQVEGRILAVRTDKGFMLVCFTQNVTERRQAEEALRQSEVNLRALIENIDGRIWSVDADYRLTACNALYREALAAHLGHEPAVGDSVLAANWPPAAQMAWRSYYDQALQGEKFGFVLPSMFPGAPRYLECFFNPIQTREGKTVGVTAFARDITERQQAEDEIRRLNAHLEQRVEERTAALAGRTAELTEANAALRRAARMKDEFLATMSHELRTPLTAVQGLSEALQMGVYGTLTDKQLKALGTIRESGQHLLNLITDILDLSKLEAGKLELQADLVAVEDICQASLRFVRQLAQKKNLHVSMVFDPAVTTLVADARRLKQMLVNLLSNAVKFTPGGGEVGLAVEGDSARQVIRFVVWDTGIGITPENLPRLFQPFTQLDSRLAREYEGTGLGLSLVQAMAELHGGEVTVASAGVPGQGSRFTLTLPWRAGEKPAAPAARQNAAAQPLPTLASPERPAESRPAAAPPVLLLVDDNENTLFALSAYLETQGYQVHTASTGAAALDLAQTLQPEVILLDIQMPGMDGLEVIRRLHANPAMAAVPILALTALTMAGDRERCLAAGATAYLSKPVELRELVQTVQTLRAGHPKP